MTVLQTLLNWSRERPSWQRDALRRLVQHGDLSDADIRAATEICKHEHGLASEQAVTVLAQEHIPESGERSAPVCLVSIFHHRGVNALAEGQILKFVPNLTVVYGDNAAGKTGYIRILKSACRARGQEEILGNVVSGQTPLSPVVSIRYKVGTEPDKEWSGDGEDVFVSRVSVFDSQCASVYLTEKTDVAFRPFGLDLFDKLVKACRAVRTNLEAERRTLASSELAAVQEVIPEGTAVASLLANISSLTSPDSVRTLASLTAEEESQLALLEKSLIDLHANDPANLISHLTLRAGRVKALSRHLAEIETVLSTDAVAAVLDARMEERRKHEEAKRLRTATFPDGILSGTGSEHWTTLWEAARRFSAEEAYPGRQFPVLGGDAQCVLCQQGLDQQARTRLEQFQAFVVSTTERELRETRQTLARLQLPFVNLTTTNDAIDQIIDDIGVEQEDLAAALRAALTQNESRRAAVAQALTQGTELPADCPGLVSATDDVNAFGNEIDARVATLRSGSSDQQRERLTADLRELRARKLLAQHTTAVIDEIERKKKLAAYELCINDTRTNAITQKNTAVTKTAVSQRLKESFSSELVRLNFHHIEVELREAGGADGVLYHKLVLTRAPGVNLPRVVSEGEQRCLSIAAFFAELSTADDPSGIVFDDPVSSLDYKWREGVARRLVEEAATRQVIVFTHDIVFLLLLKQFSREQEVDQLDQHVRQLSKGAGVCAEELPWVAMSVKKKIGFLKTQWQSADKLFRDGHQSAYEKEAEYLYGLLREAWERALEEVLLAGVVERFRPGVQTQQIESIADISPQDCRTIDAAMSKCSKWLPGHDQAPAARAPVPESSELKADIRELEAWVASIRQRR